MKNEAYTKPVRANFTASSNEEPLIQSTRPTSQHVAKLTIVTARFMCLVISARARTMGSLLGRRRLVSPWMGLDRNQDLFDGLSEFSEVGVCEFLAELVVGVFGSAGDSHLYILASRG